MTKAAIIVGLGKNAETNHERGCGRKGRNGRLHAVEAACLYLTAFKV